MAVLIMSKGKNNLTDGHVNIKRRALIMSGKIKDRSVKEIEAEIDLIYHHCRFHGKRIEEGLFRLKEIYVGAELLYYLLEHKIPYSKNGIWYVITIDEPQIHPSDMKSKNHDVLKPRKMSESIRILWTLKER